jgi:hypothetical protein
MNTATDVVQLVTEISAGLNKARAETSKRLFFPEDEFVTQVCHHTCKTFSSGLQLVRSALMLDVQFLAVPKF